MKELNTDRLYLRKITEDDCERIFSCWASDDEVTKHLTWHTHQCVETTKLVVAHWLNAYENEKCYRYGVELKETKELIGMIDVVGYRDGSPVIGYVLGRAYWNKGYMTEALKAVIDELFHDGYSSILVKADERNIASTRVILKNGFTFVHKETRARSPLKPEIVTVNSYRKQR
jgi:ribosomal-protein-alanine N-acetyltransferase